MDNDTDYVVVSYVGPHDEIQIASTGQTCERGEAIEVSAETAGWPPSDPEADLAYALEPDAGDGLLAQADTWVVPDGETVPECGRERVALPVDESDAEEATVDDEAPAKKSRRKAKTDDDPAATEIPDVGNDDPNTAANTTDEEA